MKAEKRSSKRQLREITRACKMLLTLLSFSAALCAATLPSPVEATATSLVGAGGGLATLAASQAARSSLQQAPASIHMQSTGISSGRASLVQQARLSSSGLAGANLHSSQVGAVTAAQMGLDNLNNWQLNAGQSASESEDCYTDLNGQIKELLNRLNKLRKLQPNKQQRELILGNLDPQTMQTSDDSSKQEAKTGDLRDIIGEHLNHLDQELIKRNCKYIEAPFESLNAPERPQPVDGPNGGLANWLRFDPSNFDYVYNTLNTYKRLLTTIVGEVERALGKTKQDYLLTDDDADVDQQQLKRDLNFDFETMDKLRAGLINGCLQFGSDTLKIKATNKIKTLLATVFSGRSNPVSSSSLGVFGPIIKMIAGSDARMAAEYLLDPGFRSSLDQANRDEPMTFLKCIDDDQVNQPQC